MIMKKSLVAALLIIAIIGIWMSYTINQKAHANAELLALLVYGQAPSTWRPMIRVPKAVEGLIDGQLALYSQVRLGLSADIVNIQNKPAGYYVSVADPAEPDGRASVPKDDWLIEANTALTAMDAHIALLQTYQ